MALWHSVSGGAVNNGMMATGAGGEFPGRLLLAHLKTSHFELTLLLKYGDIPLNMVAHDPNKILSPCHCALLRKASRYVSLAYDSAIAPSGLKTTQLSLLATINRAADLPPTQKELAEMMLMDRSTLGQNLRPLEKQGFVTLSTDSKDGRSKRVQLTAKGRSKLTKALSLWQDVQSRFESNFGNEATARLRDILAALVATDFSPEAKPSVRRRK